MEKLFKIGYSNALEAERVMSGNEELLPARIIAEHKELYILSNGEKEFSAKVTGKMIFTATSREDFPAVGDWVLISMLDDKTAVIKSIMPRMTMLKRKTAGRDSDIQIIASNIDTAFIMLASDRDYNIKRIERYMALVKSGSIDAAVILNKIDIIDENEIQTKVNELNARFPEMKVFATSTVDNRGIEELRSSITKAKTYCFIGSSGVGKSSIINVLAGRELMKTGEISEGVEKGRHVTTHRQLSVLENGALLIDTPGMREIAVIDAEAGLSEIFSEFIELTEACRFTNCTHTHEPGCAVLEALEKGEIDIERYENYMKLLKENRHHTSSNQQRRQSEKQFAKHKKNYNNNFRNK